MFMFTVSVGVIFNFPFIFFVDYIAGSKEKP